MFGATKDNMASANANANAGVNVAKGLVNRHSQDSDAYSSTESITSGYLCVASINSEPSETKNSRLEDLTKLSWLLDTDASKHITNRKDVIEKSIPSSNQQIIVADGQMIRAQGIGRLPGLCPHLKGKKEKAGSQSLERNLYSYKVHGANFVIFDELHSKVPYDVILAQQKEELEELCKNEGLKIDSPTINNDGDDGKSTISLEDQPRITSLNRQSCQQPITKHYENGNGNDHSDYQTEENISKSDLSSIQNLEHHSTPKNLPLSLETSVPESRLVLEEPLQLENLTKTQIKQAQIAHRKAEKEAKIQAEWSARRLMEIQRGDRRGRSAAEKANLTKLLENARREENHPRLTAGALPRRIHIPLTIKEAKASPDWEQWKSAVDEEIRSVKENGTFSDPIEKPKDLSNHELVTAEFVLNIK
ncbi:hypothetical protein K3495_g413 [Podosphaera aphanis]|nr:hypothetical protein K3495_g413 [Podosphaera aphanis]